MAENSRFGKLTTVKIQERVTSNAIPETTKKKMSQVNDSYLELIRNI